MSSSSSAPRSAKNAFVLALRMVSTSISPAITLATCSSVMRCQVGHMSSRPIMLHSALRAEVVKSISVSSTSRQIALIRGG
jgi:hypothetical protein